MPPSGVTAVADTARIAALADAVASRPGPWTTRRASQLYRELGYAAPYRRTARRDLRALTRRGLLQQHETPGRTYYTRQENRP